MKPSNHICAILAACLLSSISACAQFQTGKEATCFVFGQVEKPGSYALKDTKTPSLGAVLRLAGGVTKDSVPLVRIYRAGASQPSFVLDLERQAGALNSTILANDQIGVLKGRSGPSPSKSSLSAGEPTIRICGDVVNPGIYKISNRENVGSIVARAGGVLNPNRKYYVSLISEDESGVLNQMSEINGYPNSGADHEINKGDIVIFQLLP